MGIILIILLILLVVGAIPTWRHSKRWGYYPSGLIGLLLFVVLIMVMMGNIPLGF